MNLFILLVSFLQFLVTTQGGKFPGRGEGGGSPAPSGSRPTAGLPGGGLGGNSANGGSSPTQSDPGQNPQSEIPVAQASGARNGDDGGIKEIQLLSRNNTICYGENIKAIIKMGTRRCTTSPHSIRPDVLIRWNNGDLQHCRNFYFGDTGHIIIEAPQSFLQNCIATVDIVLQDGTRYVSRKNSGWGSRQSVEAVQWLVPTSTRTAAVCPDTSLSCPKEYLQSSGWSEPVYMQCFPEPGCDHVSDTRLSLNTENTGYKCYQRDTLTPNIKYCCQSKQVVNISGEVTIPQCEDNRQRRTSSDEYNSSGVAIIGPVAIYN